jgi:hypothetical protein
MKFLEIELLRMIEQTIFGWLPKPGQLPDILHTDWKFSVGGEVFIMKYAIVMI